MKKHTIDTFEADVSKYDTLVSRLEVKCETNTFDAEFLDLFAESTILLDCFDQYFCHLIDEVLSLKSALLSPGIQKDFLFLRDRKYALDKKLMQIRLDVAKVLF